MEHLQTLGDWFARVEAGPGWRQPREVAWAMLFHDGVYEPGQPDNEARSAALAREVLSRHPEETCALHRVVALIEWTAQHGSDPLQWANDPDAGHFLDADMAILGADPETFARYERGVRAEFLHAIPAEAFDTGRRHFLASLLTVERFITPFFRDRLDAQAQQNLRSALGLDAQG